MLTKNQIYEAVVTDYTAEGQGVAHIEGCAVFIPNAIAGEKYKVRIELARKTWAAGKIVEILEKTPHRVNRECPVAKLCGGCDFWHMDYEEETRLKAERVRTCLNRMGGESLDTVPILAAPTCHGYRNKAQYPVSSRKSRAYAGFFRAGTHDVVENDRCLILPAEMDQVKDIVIAHMNRFRIPAYDETAHTGLVRHIYVRRGVQSGQVLVCLSANGRKLPQASELVDALKKVPGFTTLVLSVNTKKGNTILGDEFITLYGPGTIEDTLCVMCHEMSHYYCYIHGIKDVSRGTMYHNKRFKEAAEARGLIVDHSDKYGWSHTAPGDGLLQFCLDNNLSDILINRNEFYGYRVTGTGTHSGTNTTLPPRTSSTRKYLCPCCGNSVRATKTVNIGCLDCGVQMREV